MKNVFTFLCIALLSMSSLFAQHADSAYVANWQFPIAWWFPNATAPAVGIDAYPRSQATAQAVTNFDAAAADFDATWTSVPGDGNKIGSTPAHIMGLAASNTGADDLKNAAFKVLYDETNMYILLQWTDDDVTGAESAEFCLSPYFKVDAPDPATNAVAWYARYNQFGANKLAFKKTGFDAAMMVNVDTAGVGSINWGGTTPTITDNTFVDDKTSTGSKTVKWIITIGYPVLTGEFRPDFNHAIWKALNAGKGISFDMKVNDVDTDDALNADPTPVKKPAEYWWNTDNNDCWQSNMYAGFLSPLDPPAASDDAYVANWKFPIAWWFPNAAIPAVGIDAYPRKAVMADGTSSFDAAAADFDATWAGISGTGNVIGETPANILGLAASNTGTDDFKDGVFKALYDESNMYILLKWTDDDVTGAESVELAMAPYFKLNVTTDPTSSPLAWYVRYNQFGANKLSFKKTGFDAAMMVTVDTAGVGAINWGGTTPTITDNTFVDDKTATGSKTVKWIITVGYPVLTGEFRPDFNTTIWKALNEGKGISFDLKVNDVDADDALNADPTPVKKPAEYWWNTDNNDCFQTTVYAGFLGAGNTFVSVPKPIKRTGIFSTVTPSRIDLNKVADIYIYNAIGQPVMAKRGVNQIDLTGLKTGAYIIRANNESMKFVR